MAGARSERDAPSLELAAPRGHGPRRAAAVALEGASAGDLRRAFALARAFDAHPVVVAVDGGLATCRAIRRRPDLFVGDLDSSPAPPPGIPARLYPAAKDHSDFAGALREIRRMDVDVVAVGGLLGGRLDHEWANIAEIGAAARGFSAILAPSERGLVAVTSRGLRVRTTGRRLVSVFALNREATVTLSGTAWTLARRRLVPGSLGLSNVTGAGLALAVHAGVVAVVFPAPPPRVGARRPRRS